VKAHDLEAYWQATQTMERIVALWILWWKQQAETRVEARPRTDVDLVLGTVATCKEGVLRQAYAAHVTYTPFIYQLHMQPRNISNLFLHKGTLTLPSDSIRYNTYPFTVLIAHLKA
jgi:hypothetical protein